VQVRVFNSATSGLEASLLVAGIGPGDEVIVPAISFVATANVVLRVGARPVFVEVDLHSRNLDAAAVAAAVTRNTRAVIPVHFAGLAVDMEPLYELAAEHDLLLLEDAAQAIGTEYQGRKIGASGNPVCFSFHPNKNMTTIEGGAVACDDPDFVARLERRRARRAQDEADRPLAAYRAAELERMRLNFYGFDPSYHYARAHFVGKVPHAWTPLHLALHRRRAAV